MSRISRVLVCAALAAIPTLVLAAVPTITDEEEHVLRGFFDRQSNIMPVNRLALEKGSDNVKKFAQSELDMYTTLAANMKKMTDEFKLINRQITGESSPKLSQGVSRGVTELPAGATWFASGVLGGGGAGGGAPGGAPPAGAAPAGAAGMGAGAAAAGMGAAPAGGGGQAKYDYDLADLQKLSGADFDKQYVLRVAIAHNAMLRHIDTELSEAGNNPDMVAFAMSSFKLIAQQNSNIENLLLGKGLGGDRPAGGAQGAAGMGAGGPPGAAPAAK